MSIVAVAISKGGAGKTTTATSVASYMATVGRTLIVDTDSQGHSAVALGLRPEPGIYQYLVADQPVRSLIRPARPATATSCGLDILPGDTKTKTVDLIYRMEAEGASQLAHKLLAVASLYDHTVIDTPSQGLLQEIAISLADHVIIPFSGDLLSTVEVSKTVRLIQRIKGAKWTASTWIIPVKWRPLQSRTENLAKLRGLVGSSHLISDHPVPERAAIEKATRAGQTVWESSRTRGLAGGYAYATRMILAGSVAS